MPTVLQVENLWKQYRLGVLGHGALYRDLQSWVARLRGKEDPNAKVGAGRQIYGDRLWALQDVSLKIERGEVLGIIGRNGAGKSTLLKIISRVTAPTQGRIKIRGRVASLLEVGTGFHHELTGRENIFLNGAILGMTVAETRKKFDEIVAFAGMEDFIETPVKRYSSGMYVRLAFAVAAHLEPEILVLDEVLAVGDAAFQKKCLGKMGNVASEGRTVLFVSHNLQAIRTLCPRTILIDQGGVAYDGPTNETLEFYRAALQGGQISENSEVHNPDYRRGSGTIRFTGIETMDQDGNKTYNFNMGDTIRFQLSYKSFKDMEGLAVFIGLRSGISHEVVTSARHVITSQKIAAGTTGTIYIEFPNTYIRPGEYPLYYQISDVGSKTDNYDIVDGLTPPLIIFPGEETNESNFDTSRPIGYFSIPSRIVPGN